MAIGQIVRYWHPRKGGWYNATLLSLGRKWAKVQDPNGKSRKIAIRDEEGVLCVREVAQ